MPDLAVMYKKIRETFYEYICEWEWVAYIIRRRIRWAKRYKRDYLL